jgi:hypothetical protein
MVSRKSPGQRQAFRDRCYAARVSPSERAFAVKVLSPLVCADGTLQPWPVTALRRAWARYSKTGTCSRIRIWQLRHALSRAGLIAPAGHSGPGTPSRWRTALKSIVSVRWIRPRGITPRRLHRAFMKELGAVRMISEPLEEVLDATGLWDCGSDGIDYGYPGEACAETAEAQGKEWRPAPAAGTQKESRAAS